MPAPSRGTARVSRGRRERARAMRRERASSKNEATASSERAGGKSGWSSAARREKTDNGKISPTRPKKKKKTQNTRATSTRSRSPSWRRSSTLRGSPRRSELRGREKRREGNLLLPRERERAELGRAARQALDFFLTPLPLSFLSSSPKTNPPSPKKKIRSRRRSTRTFSGCRTSATPPPTATSSARRRPSSRTSWATCSKRLTRGPTRSTP